MHILINVLLFKLIQRVDKKLCTGFHPSNGRGALLLPGSVGFSSGCLSSVGGLLVIGSELCNLAVSSLSLLYLGLQWQAEALEGGTGDGGVGSECFMQLGTSVQAAWTISRVTDHSPI